MKFFDFSKCPRNEQVTAWLRSNHGKNISEDRYEKIMRGLESRNKGPAKRRKEYRRLVRVFGFFGSANN